MRPRGQVIQNKYTTTVTTTTKHVKAANNSTVANSDECETSEGSKLKKGRLSSGCDMCSKRDRTFCDSVVHGKEIAFEGL